MPIIFPPEVVPEYTWRLDTHGPGARPSSALGATVTPGNNTKGSYAELIDGALVVNDVWAIEITINSGNASIQARDILVDIATDPTAGTSYSVIINNLLGSMAGGMRNFDGCPIRYLFPLYIPAGSSIAARASVNNATVGTVRVLATLYGLPTIPARTRRGTSVQTIGAVTASSRGTAVTSGTTSEGAWTELGTLTNDAWWWQFGVGFNDSSMGGNLYGIDLSAGASGGDVALMDELFASATNLEALTFETPAFKARRRIAGGSKVWGRMQCDGTPDDSPSIAAYALS